MTGAEQALRTAVNAGVDVCFANPGTTEMDWVAAIDTVDGMRGVLGLFEGVVTGAADGYGRVAGKPALTLLHLGPGFANGIANLHNARRANSGVVNIIGDHADWHLGADAPLTSDIESLASPVSAHVVTPDSATSLVDETATAIARASVGETTSLIVRQNHVWETTNHMAKVSWPARRQASADQIRAAAKACASGPETVLYLGGTALTAEGLNAAERIRVATGCRVFAETFSGKTERGAGISNPERIPYFPEQGKQALDGAKQLVLAGATDPVAFFGYKEGISRLAPADCELVELSPPTGDATAAIVALADELGAEQVEIPSIARPELPTGELNAESLGAAIAALQPEGAIVVEEGATSSLGYAGVAHSAPPHLALGLTGGAIGTGLPLCVGAAVAAPDRKVIGLQADGSAMYTIQGLWTMARENLDVCVVMCANRGYKILQFELFRAGVSDFGPAASGLTDLTNPTIEFTSIAKGLGVDSVQATTSEELVAGIRAGLSSDGPFLVEAVL